MGKHMMHYETLLKVTEAISMSKDPQDVVVTTVEALKTALKTKGAALFLVNRKNNELELAAANGLSREYLDKGPLSAVSPSPFHSRRGRLPFTTWATTRAFSTPRRPGERGHRLPPIGAHCDPRSSDRLSAGLHRRTLGVHH